MKLIKEMSLGELAAYVCTHLQKNDIHCILTGGACVSIYTENKYKSYDLDFIENVASKRKDITAALSKIGFFRRTNILNMLTHNTLLSFLQVLLRLVKNQCVSQILKTMKQGNCCCFHLLIV